MYKSIAITGISFELPGMKDWAELSQSLGRKDVMIGALPPGRLQDFQNFHGPVELTTGGFLVQVDQFDNLYFDMTDREAVKTFPEHRLFLMHSLRAFYDAGYTAKDIKQSNTGIFLSPSRSQYPRYLNGQFDFYDTLTGIEATRLARFLDLRGPAMSVNTTCSSSLTAVHTACLSLAQKECDMALVGGVKIATVSREGAERVAIMSRSGVCRPFDENADGTMNGEGAICMVLKRLEDAERDNDPVYGVIEGGAVNHGGARITSLTAPSIEAQKEVILKAWENARIEPGDIKFIEAHGTGTILGDPIEFGGINEAFHERGISAGTCRISSVKAQIGHLDTMCGMAGLLRLIAALNNKIIPPQANFAIINEHIDEAGSAVEVQREPEYWETDNGIRTGGVSSFGLTGTNVHMVISQKEMKQTGSGEPYYFLQIGEITKDRLAKLKQQHLQFLEQHPSVDLAAFSQKVNRLYNVSKYNEGIIFADRDDLLKRLSSPADKPIEEAAFFLLDIDLLSYDRELIKKVLNENSIINKCWEHVIGEIYTAEHITDNNVLSVLFQYVLYKYLLSVLGNKLQIISRQGESVLQKLLNNKLQPATIINDPALISINNRSFNKQNFESYLAKNFLQQRVILIDFSSSNEMHFANAHNIININGGFHSKERYTLYKELLAANTEPLKAPNVAVHFPGIQLPFYQLRRFWPVNTPKVSIDNTAAELAKKAAEQQPERRLSVEEITDRVKSIWKKILELEQDIAPADDFFEIGGDSLSGLDMLSQLNKEFKGIIITYEEMFSFSTLEKLCATIQERLAPKHVAPEKKLTQVAVKDATVRKEEYTALLEAIRNNPVPDKVIHQDILITGATGMLGTFIVKRIMDTTGANIICLVRGKNDEEASARFWEVYHESFGIEQHERIKVIHGDLNNEHLFKELPIQQSLQHVSTVYHAAGSTAYVGSPDLNNHINYRGTRHIYDWAVENKIPYFNYISSIGITGQRMPEHIDAFYETDLNLGQETKNYVHSGTKLMAEEYILNHRLPDTIVNTFRISNLGGRFTDGFTRFNMNKNLMYLKLQRVLKAGFYSDKSLTYNLNFKVVPVDIQVAAVCDLSFYRHKFLNTFHLSLEGGFTLGEIINAFDKNNIVINRIEHDRFLEYIDKWQDSTEDHAVNLMKYGSYDKKWNNNYRIIADATKLTLKKIKADLYYDRSEYLSNVVNYCIKEGFLSTNSNLIKT